MVRVAPVTVCERLHAGPTDVLLREMAVGNTFGATALSSYGGFWIGVAIILTPGGFQIHATLEEAGPYQFMNSFGLYLMVSRSSTFWLVTSD